MTDLNQDSVFNHDDLDSLKTLIQNPQLQQYLSTQEFLTYDINGDGEINHADVTALMKLLIQHKDVLKEESERSTLMALRNKLNV